jgi:hypothetical protein
LLKQLLVSKLKLLLTCAGKSGALTATFTLLYCTGAACSCRIEMRLL